MITVPPAPPPAPKNVSLLDIALQPPPPPPPPVIVTLIRFVPGVGVYVPDDVKTRVYQYAALQTPRKLPKDLSNTRDLFS